MSRSMRPELCDLVEELHDVKRKWYRIGIQLKVPESKLNEIESTDNDNLERAFRRMIQQWLEQAEPEPTWADITKVLRSRSVNEQCLAQNLERRFCTTSLDAAESTAVAAWSANTASSSEQDLDPEVQQKLKELYQLFEELRLDVYHFLSKMSPDLKEFRVFVSSPPPAWKVKRQRPLTEVDLERIMKSDEFHEVYMVLSQYIDWYNYELLKSIVNKYGDPTIKRQMQDYCTKLDEFEVHTNLDAVKNIQLCQPQPDAVAVIVKMPNNQCSQLYLNETRRIKHNIADEAGIDHAAMHTFMAVQSS